MSFSLLLAAGIPPKTAALLALGLGLLAFVGVFLVLFARFRPPKPIARVAIVKGPSAGQGAALAGERLRIGRDGGNDLVIEDEELSRFHCEIRNDGGVTVIIDQGSANGTRVNGKDVKSTVLKAGDEIAIGASVLRCS